MQALKSKIQHFGAVNALQLPPAGEDAAQWENDKEFIGRIESQLTEKLGISPIVSNDGTLSFYKLR